MRAIFFLRILDAVRDRGMRREDLGDGARAALFIGLMRSKKVTRSLIVACLVHVLQTKEVGFLFGVAAELRNVNGIAKIQPLVHRVARHAIRDEKSSGWTPTHDLALSSVFRSMTGGHVSYFVRHHAREFRFFLGAED